MKKYWRCTVCGDVHYGLHAPSECPSCTTPDSYIEITKEEAMKALGF